MLIEFRVANFKSIKEEQIFTMLPNNRYSEHPENVMSVIVQGKKGLEELKLLKTAVIFGANASGKTNLLNALRVLNFNIMVSHTLQDKQELYNLVPFALDEEDAQKPSFFELSFLVDNIKYVYGLEVSAEKIHKEYLSWWPKGKEEKIFYREDKHFELLPLGQGIKDEAFLDLLKQEIRDNQIALAMLTYRNYELTKNVFTWFSSYLKRINGYGFNVNEGDLNKELFNNSDKRKLIDKVLKKADFGISGVEVNVREVTRTGRSLLKIARDEAEIENNIEKSYEAYFIHEVNGKKAIFPFRDESEGTKKFYNLYLEILRVMDSGGVLFVDEIDSSMHSLLTIELLRAIHEYQGNNFQLIATTHNVELFDKECELRRDQYWFVNKDRRTGASELYSLSEYKDVRKDLDLRKAYLNGRFDAVPVPNLRRIFPSARKD